MDYDLIKQNNKQYYKTKNICIYSFISMIIIILFFISPLRNYLILSKIMGSIAIIILIYVIYLNFIEGYKLQKMATQNKSNEYTKQLQINIMCSYMFTLFLVLLAYYTFVYLIN